MREDIAEAVNILSEFGAERVYLFGSIVTRDKEAEIHDIDIAVAGLPAELFFRAYGRMMISLSHPFDLVDLDNDAAFIRTLKESGQLEQVA